MMGLRRQSAKADELPKTRGLGRARGCRTRKRCWDSLCRDIRWISIAEKLRNLTGRGHGDGLEMKPEPAVGAGQMGRRTRFRLRA